MTGRQLAKQILVKSGIWSLGKFILPRYHRPALGLAAARMKARFAPSPANAQDLARAFLAWADVLAYQDAWPEVVVACDNALRADPACLAALQRRNEVLLRLGRLLMRNVHDQTSSEKSLELINAGAKRFEAVLGGPPGASSTRAAAREELVHCYALLGRWEDIERLNRPV